MIGYGVTLIPASWAFGVWRKPHKTLFAIGPLRFVHYRLSGAWKRARVDST
jgi:hypothetical protein